MLRQSDPFSHVGLLLMRRLQQRICRHSSPCLLLLHYRAGVCGFVVFRCHSRATLAALGIMAAAGGVLGAACGPPMRGLAWSQQAFAPLLAAVGVEGALGSSAMRLSARATVFRMINIFDFMISSVLSTVLGVQIWVLRTMRHRAAHNPTMSAEARRPNPEVGLFLRDGLEVLRQMGPPYGGERPNSRGRREFQTGGHWRPPVSRLERRSPR